MVMSMTGYGNHTVESGLMTISVEIRTVNSRYLDFVAKMPHTFNNLENDLKQIIKEYFNRGRIDLFLHVTGKHDEQKALKVDWDLMDQYVAELEKAKTRYNLAGDPALSMLTQIEGLFQIDETEDDFDILKDPIFEAVHAVCKKVNKARKSEGTFLFKDIKQHLNSFQQMLNSLKHNEARLIDLYRKRIEERLHHYIDKKNGIQTERLYQEIALLAEKGNISEEITRLYSHIEHFNDITENGGPLGRQLDFIIQEMHREVNTIGAKSVDSEISKLVVSMKRDIEKMKEQVQNIE